MWIEYAFQTDFIVDARLDEALCDNCGHTAKQLLARQVNRVVLYKHLKLINITAKRGIMCACCGNCQRLSAFKYRRRLALQKIQHGE